MLNQHYVHTTLDGNKNSIKNNRNFIEIPALGNKEIQSRKILDKTYLDYFASFSAEIPHFQDKKSGNF